MAFEVVVLGASGTFPAPGAACSGYLLRSGGSDVWVDAGPGTFANLQRHTGYLGLSAVVLSHLHLDHILDVYPFYYALRYAPGAPEPRGIEVYAPAGAAEHLAGMLHGDAGFGGYLSFRTVAPGGELEVDGLRFRFGRSVHPVETLAMRVEAEGRVLAYTADTGPGGEMAALVRGAHVLIAEASLQAPVESLAEVHMTAEEAGALAAEAGVERLVLAHIPPGLDPQVSVAHAAKRFGGEVLIGADGLTVRV